MVFVEDGAHGGVSAGDGQRQHGNVVVRVLSVLAEARARLFSRLGDLDV